MGSRQQRRDTHTNSNYTKGLETHLIKAEWIVDAEDNPDRGEPLPLSRCDTSVTPQSNGKAAA